MIENAWALGARLDAWRFQVWVLVLPGSLYYFPWWDWTLFSDSVLGKLPTGVVRDSLPSGVEGERRTGSYA